MSEHLFSCKPSREKSPNKSKNKYSVRNGRTVHPVESEPSPASPTTPPACGANLPSLGGKGRESSLLSPLHPRTGNLLRRTGTSPANVMTSIPVFQLPSCKTRTCQPQQQKNIAFPSVSTASHALVGSITWVAGSGLLSGRGP